MRIQGLTGRVVLRLLPAVLIASPLILCEVLSSTTRANASFQSRPSGQPRPLSKSAAQLGSQFGFDLFGRLRASTPPSNVFISPISVAMVLAMLYNGAANDTARAVGKVLHIEGMKLDDVNNKVLTLRNALKPSGTQYELSIANSVWARQGMAFENSFLDRNRQFFGAEIANVNFASRQTLDQINGWVSKNTGGHIPKIIDRIDASHVMFLINAVYFKGQWKDRFDRKYTKTEPFELADRTKVQVPLMARTGKFLYRSGERHQAVSIPYTGDKISMVVLLPEKGFGLDDFLKQLDARRWDGALDVFQMNTGEVKLPRFTMNYQATLNDALKSLGMGVAFDVSKADLTLMRKQRDLVLSEVKHKTYVDVNEEGTTASAATSAGISVTSVRMDPFQFVADRPFIIAIKEDSTGAILFLGAIRNPK